MVLIIKHHSEMDGLERTFGLLVDKVQEIISFDESKNSYLLKFIPSSDNPFVSGTILLEDRNILLPNFSKIASTLILNEDNVH